MNQFATNLPASANYSLTFFNGEKKGTRFKLASPKITLGRSSDNDISIEYDNKCSRLHAIIEYGPHGYEIRSQSQKNPAIVDGQEVNHALLHNGAVIQLGQTKLQFQVEILSPNTELQVKSSQYAVPEQELANPNRQNKHSGNSKRISPTFKILIFLGIIFFAWLFLSETGSQKNEIEITSDRDIEAEIEAAKQIKKAKEDELRASNRNTVQYRDAQANYVKGFRDFQKRQYGRARDSFQTCLSLFPEHVLCERYLNLSTRKFNEVVQNHMILGMDYRDRNQFQACMSSLKTVMVMVKDKNSKIYQQAKANYDACKAQIGERY